MSAGFPEEKIPVEFLKKRAEQLSPQDFHLLSVALIPS
jgi:hypothetical protein